MKTLVHTVYSLILSVSEWLAPLLMRFTVGWVFLTSGIWKLRHVPHTVEYFQSLGIAWASFQAPLVGGVECVGGALVLMGMFTRFAAIALIIIMKVAIYTAKPEALGSLAELLQTAEFLYLVILLALVATGAGRWSVDYLIRRKV